MKTNSTILKYAILLIVILFSSQSKATNTPYDFTFNSTPTLVSGTALTVGAKYKFTNVASGLDAYVTIVGATGGASVAILDDNSLTKPEAFSPKVNVPANSTGMVEFKIEFINGGGSLKLINQLTATAMDIDGSSTLHEMDALDMGPGCMLSYKSSSLEINVTQSGTEFLGTNVAGVEYSGVDTAAKQVMFTLTNNNISGFTYKAGANNQTSSLVSRQKGIYFKGFNYSSLAVKYSSFDAVAADRSVILKWGTELEINNNHFEVERSFDGINFFTIGIVLDGFAVGSKKSYQFKDNSAEIQSKTVAYYRLKQIDNDGKMSLTNTLVVKLQAKAGVVMQTTPNPFIENLSVRFTATANGNAQINIININGQKVITKESGITKGYNTLQLSGLTKLAPGIYVAQLIMDGIVIDNQKIIKN